VTCVRQCESAPRCCSGTPRLRSGYVALRLPQRVAPHRALSLHGSPLHGSLKRSRRHNMPRLPRRRTQHRPASLAVILLAAGVTRSADTPWPDWATHATTKAVRQTRRRSRQRSPLLSMGAHPPPRPSRSAGLSLLQGRGSVPGQGPPLRHAARAASCLRQLRDGNTQLPASAGQVATPTPIPSSLKQPLAGVARLRGFAIVLALAWPAAPPLVPSPHPRGQPPAARPAAAPDAAATGDATPARARRGVAGARRAAALACAALQAQGLRMRSAGANACTPPAACSTC